MNKKIAFLIASLFILGLVQVQCSYSYGYIQNFGNTKHAEKNKQDQIYNDKNFEDLISHNLGLLQQSSVDKLSKEFIQNFGKQNIFDPVYLNYIFMIESNYLAQQKKDNIKLNGIQIKLDVCNNSNLTQQDCILNRLFDKTNNQSLVNKLSQLYGDEYHRNLAYLYATKADAYYFKDYILQLDHQEDGSIQITEPITGSHLKIPGTLESCVNQISEKQFYFDLKNNKIYNNKNISITINDQNRDGVINFMRDICSMNQLSKLLRKEQQPDVFTFYISSIGQLEKVMSKDDMFKILQIWNISYEKFVNNVQKVFKNNEIAGQMIFVKAQPQVAKHQFFQINQNNTTTKKVTSRRILQNSGAISKTSKPDSQIFIWLFLFLAFVLFFAVLALLQMDFERDSLLYAKFIATDYK